MSNVAYLPIEADRYGACVRQIYLRGFDATGIAMRAQVRLAGDTPGAPLVDLETVTNTNAEGLRLVAVTVEDGTPVSHIEMVINETTLEGLPYSGEFGAKTVLAWDCQLTIAGRKQRLARGEFIITGDGVTGADNAPAGRSNGWATSVASSAGMRTGATLTFGEDVLSVTVDGADLVGAQVERAVSAATQAVEAAGNIASFTGAVSSFYIEPTEFQQGNYSTLTGEVLADRDNFRHALLPATPGEQFLFTGSITSGNAAVAVFYDSNGTFMSGSAQYPGTDGVTIDYTEIAITTPPNAGFVGFSGFVYNGAGFAASTLIKRMNVAGDVSDAVETLEASLSTYQDEPLALQTGRYFWPDGTVVSDDGFRRVLLQTKPGEKLLYSGVVSSGAQAAAVYFDANGAHIPNAERFVGANGQSSKYIDQEIESPAGAFGVGFTSSIFDADGFAVTLKVKRPKVLTNAAQRIMAIEDGGTSPGTPGDVTSYWAGKKIAWFGTSIPETGYPLLVGEALGANVVNEAVGSSSARFGVASKRNVAPGDKYGISGLSWFLAVRSLSKTAAEAEDLIANWATYRPMLDPASSPPATLSSGEADYIRETSWEVKLNRNLDADLFVFDHGYNDWFANRYGTTAGGTSGGSGDMLYVPSDTRDRGTYLGAMNFLIDKILQANPRARIAFTSHYEDDRDANVVQGQTALAGSWNFSFVKLYEKMGWGNQSVVTTGYWTDRFTWNPTGGSSRSLLLVNIWMQDGLHPYSTPAKRLIADNLTPELDRIR